MTTPILTWLLIVSLMAVFFLTNAVLVRLRHRHATVDAHDHHHHIVEIGTETDEFFLPGDESDHDIDTIDDTDN